MLDFSAKKKRKIFFGKIASVCVFGLERQHVPVLGVRKLNKMEDREAELRAEIKLGKMGAVGRVILYSDTRASDERSHWEVVDVADLKHLPPYVSKDRALTPTERTKTTTLSYKSGLEWPSRVFARVASGKSTFFLKYAHVIKFRAHCATYYIQNMLTLNLPARHYQKFEKFPFSYFRTFLQYVPQYSTSIALV